MIRRYFPSTSSSDIEIASHLSEHTAIIKYQKCSMRLFPIRHKTLGSLSLTVIMSSWHVEHE